MDSSIVHSAPQTGAAQSSDKLFHRITAGVVMVLLGMTFFQAIEIGRLRGYAQAQDSGAVPTATNISQPANPSPAAGNPTGLPSQVGGC